VERRRRVAATMARTEHGHPARVCMHTSQRRLPGDIYAGLGGTSRTTLSILSDMPLADVA